MLDLCIWLSVLGLNPRSSPHRILMKPAPQEFAAGKQLLSGEYLLPSGTALPFGAMISKLRREQMMGEVMAGGEARSK